MAPEASTKTRRKCSCYYKGTEGFMQELGYYPNSRDSNGKEKELEMETEFGLVWDRMKESKQ